MFRAASVVVWFAVVSALAGCKDAGTLKAAMGAALVDDTGSASKRQRDITLRLPSDERTKVGVIWASEAGLKAMRWLSRMDGEMPAEALTIRFVAPTKDRYGNDLQVEFFTLGWAFSDLSKVNWAGIEPHNIMQIAAPRNVTLAGHQALLDWCPMFGRGDVRICSRRS